MNRLWRSVQIAILLEICVSAVEARFTEVTEETGLVYRHSIQAEVPSNESLGLDRRTQTLVSNHAGAAALDVNGDGWTDFVAGRWNDVPALFLNQGDGTFVEEGASRGLAVALDAASFGAGDFDNDGDIDLFAAPHRGDRFFLLVNDGNGFFSEEAVLRGAAVAGIEYPHEGYSVGLVDFDLDGFLDVYVSEWGPSADSQPELHSVLLRNRGDAFPGYFENVTRIAGLVQPEAGVGSQHGFSSGWADFDEDGWPDLALLADFGGSRLYWNRGQGEFAEGTDAAGVGLDEFGMGIAVADYDLDGDLDYYATSIFDAKIFEATGTNTGNKLYQNIGDRRFVEVAKAANVERVGWSWGAAFFEYDNDGDPDLFVTNGMDTGEEHVFFYQDALDDSTTVFQNNGVGVFGDITSASGVRDRGYGKAVVVLDYDNDGDEDIIVTQTYGEAIVYRSNASENGKRWIRFSFQGDRSNRDGIGTLVTVKYAGRIQKALYNPSNAYIGQREPFLHIGLGEGGTTVEHVEVRWPSGIVQRLENLDTNTVHLVEEPDLEVLPPLIQRQPSGGTFEVGDAVKLEIQALSGVGVSYVWEKEGKAMDGATRSTFEIKRLQPYDAGAYRVRVINPAGETVSEPAVVFAEIDVEERSVARWWNEFLLDSIRKDFPDPTKHARNLYHLSAAMWDAYWAYELNGWDIASPVFVKEDLGVAWGEVDREEAQRKAISYACYRILKHRYAESVNAERIRYNIDWLMASLGYDVAFGETHGDSPEAVGNRIGQAIIDLTSSDGSNEENGYIDESGYQAVNDPLVFKLSGTQMNDPNHWQPLAFDFRVTQNGLPDEEKVQRFLGSNWREVETFAIEKDSGITIAWDPGPPPFFGTETHSEYVDAAVEVIRYSSLLDPDQEERIDISPSSLLNNPLGTNDGAGRSLNPYTGEPYAANLVKHADYGRILAEFWADGPASETPPGHWNTLLNEVGDHPLFEAKYMGLGDPLSELEWNVQSYLALNGAMHDAAIAAWTLKRQYDYSRPISMIRYLGGLGQCSDQSLPSYHAQGLPLIEGLIEVITLDSSAPGGRHEALASERGKVAIRVWAGQPADSDTQWGGVDWILAEDWVPYQRSTFVSPAFAGYVSGHSTFSRAGAEVISLLTGSPFFPGGIGEFHFPRNEYLEFEVGPSEDVTLQWATYFDAADQAGLSRLYGGIHVRADDFVGRVLGARIGVEAFLKAHSLRVGPRGRPSLADARIAYQLSEDGSGPQFVELDFVDGRGRTMWKLKQSQDFAADAAQGLYFKFGDAGERRNVQLYLRTAAVSRARVASAGGEEAACSLMFEVTQDEPVLLAFRAWDGSVFRSLSRSRNEPLNLQLWRMDAAQPQLVVASSSVGRASEDSVVEVLSLRSGLSGGLFQEMGAGFVRGLEKGSYRLDAAVSDGAGGVSFEIEDVSPNHYEPH